MLEKIGLLFFYSFIVVFKTYSQEPTIGFNKSLGGSGVDVIYDITSDIEGNLVLAGFTDSNNGDISCTSQGNGDVWLVCMDLEGNILWQQCYGGSEAEFPSRIIRTSDHGFLVTCRTFSNDGDISGYHGNSDIWIVKTDSMGVLKWQRCLGTSGGDFPKFSMQLKNGKYLIASITLGADGDFTEHYGNGFGLDAWITILNTDGAIDTSYHYGGSKDDQIREVIEKPNGERVFIGFSDSYDYDLITTFEYGSDDGWIFKTDSDNNLIWTNRWGGSNVDQYISGVELMDGGYLLLGSSASTSGEFLDNHGDVDIWVVKVDSLGKNSWQKFYGGSKADASDGENRLSKLNDNLFAIGGWSNSDDGDVGLNYGKEDYWFLSVDSGGNIISKKVLGGSDNDYMYSSRYIISREFQVGQTYSNDHDISLSHGDGDGWVVELSNVDIIGEFNIDTLQIKVYPNPINGGFNILLPDQLLQKGIFIEIISMNGILLQRDEVKTKNHQVLFPVRIAGTFLYQFKDDNGKVLAAGKLIFS